MKTSRRRREGETRFCLFWLSFHLETKLFFGGGGEGGFGVRILSHHSSAKKAHRRRLFQIQCLLMMPLRREERSTWYEMVKKSSTQLSVRGSGRAQKRLVSRIIEILSPLSVTPKRVENIEMNNLRRERGKKTNRPTNPQVDFHSKVPSWHGYYFWGFAIVKCKSEVDVDALPNSR